MATEIRYSVAANLLFALWSRLKYFVIVFMDRRFLKFAYLQFFQDSEEITNIELADAFKQMWSKRRYHEIFFMIDTCQVRADRRAIGKVHLFRKGQFCEPYFNFYGQF